MSDAGPSDGGPSDGGPSDGGPSDGGGHMNDGGTRNGAGASGGGGAPDGGDQVGGDQGGDAPDGGLRLADAFDVADLDTFLSRARVADPEGAVRLTAHGQVLLVTVRVVPGAGLFGGGGVLGMRALRLAADAAVDVVVAIEAVADRLARMKRTGDLVLPVPPAQVVAPWAGHAPPRSGWEPVADVAVGSLREIAQAGIAEIATGVGGPAGGGPAAGALAVEELRRRVWNRPAPDLAGGPAGLAFGAQVLGFLAGAEPGRVLRAGPWWRLSTPGGQIAAR